LTYAGRARFPRAPNTDPGKQCRTISSSGPTARSSSRPPRTCVTRHIAGYAGIEGKHFAFALTLILDEVGRHICDLDEDLRARVVEGCRAVLGQA
jgi:hypothetical protein